MHRDTCFADGVSVFRIVRTTYDFNFYGDSDHARGIRMGLRPWVKADC